MSCDNLPDNGRALRGAILIFAAALDDDLARWLDGELRCPSTMVDRIVPATTAAERAEVEAALGLEDAWPVVTERFSQWVIEDDFPLGRPAWERGGAEIVADVTPYELMKLRTLNGAHSTLAYLGYLMGAETVADAMAEPDLAELVRAMMVEEVSPTLPRLDGFDLAAYREALLTRFRNPALAPSHLADRDGRLAETAAAALGNDPRRASPPARRFRASRSASRRGCAIAWGSTRRAGRSTCATR